MEECRGTSKEGTEVHKRRKAWWRNKNMIEKSPGSISIHKLQQHQQSLCGSLALRMPECICSVIGVHSKKRDAPGVSEMCVSTMCDKYGVDWQGEYVICAA